jgi:hypothetical protein
MSTSRKSSQQPATNQSGPPSDGAESSTFGLWNEAYEDLRAKEKPVINKYEFVLSGQLDASASTTTAISSTEVNRLKQMEIVLASKMEEVNGNTWRLSFGSYEISVRDLVKNVASVVSSANDYIKGAVSASPPAAIAWAGVRLLLPVSPFGYYHSRWARR